MVAEGSVPEILVEIQRFDFKLPLSSHGDGLIKVLRYFLGILLTTQEFPRLMLDEVDAGIHHSRMAHYIKALILIAAEYNVQLFMTTHSKEFLQKFEEVLHEPEMQQFQKEVRAYRLLVDKDGEVFSSKYTFEDFKFQIEAENEIR